MLIAAVVASALCLVIGYSLGFYNRELLDRIKRLERRTPDTKTPAETSAIIEPPLTPAERVVRDQEELLERLNPSE